MTIFHVHEYYRQRGGEDQVVAAEHDLLVSRGHDVVQYTAHNGCVDVMSIYGRVRAETE